MSLTKAQAATLKAHLDAENAHDLAPTLATLTEDCRFEDIPLGEIITGRTGAAAYYETWWRGFPDLTVTVGRRHLTATGVISEVAFRGTHQGEFRGLPASGRRLDLPLIILVEMAGPLLAGERFYYDALTIQRQLAGPAEMSGRLDRLGQVIRPGQPINPSTGLSGAPANKVTNSGRLERSRRESPGTEVRAESSSSRPGTDDHPRS